jgi:two-component system response regulator CpxR
VLKKVKKERPEIEVIILTGHGSEADRRMCMDLGAFDYLQKPVDINHLSQVLKNAHARIRGKIQEG